MSLKNLKIRTQLIISLGFLLAVVLILGMIAYFENDRIHRQTDIIYNHPLKVRTALGRLDSDVLSVQSNVRDLILAGNEREIKGDEINIDARIDDAKFQIGILNDNYLGPSSDIDSLNQAFIKWRFLIEETISHFKSGQQQDVLVHISSSGENNLAEIELQQRLNIIDDFAEKKATELFTVSQDLNRSMGWQLVIIVAGFLLLSIIIFLRLLRNIRRPLNELMLATHLFRHGDLYARCNYMLDNEFGTLSASFNQMADDLQHNIEISSRSEELKRLMLSEDDAMKFFDEILNKLCELTGSQMAAAYLLSEDKTSYDHFTSVGLDPNAKQSFSASGREGEFGLALATHKIQHLKESSKNDRFIFNAVAGDLIPAEIITIPIGPGDEIIALISIASLRRYSPQTIRLIENIFVPLSVRIQGVLTFRKVKEIYQQLEHQNIELESQKTELISQSALLTEQNTELEIQKKQLAEANRLKTNFLSNMSHELRTPLNSIIALSGVLHRRLAGRIPEEEHSYIDVVERNGRHLLDTINDLLDIARIESGKVEMEISKFKLDELLLDVTGTIMPQAKQKKIELLYNEKGKKQAVSTDTDKLRHILMNVIGNAVKFTEKGKVTVKTRFSGDKVEIVVSDTGIGISEENLPYIFDEFRQADGSTSRRFGGTGLGLALAKKYAVMLKGTISVKSKLSKGSEFTISIPVNYTDAPGDANAPPDTDETTVPPGRDREPSSSGRKRTVLLVEDSEPAIIQMKDVLEQNGLNVIIARNGEEGLMVTEKTIPDVMILDLMMPGIDGFQVLKVIRESEKTAHIPVLILTSKYVTKEELNFLKENNIHQLIQKGNVDMKNLITMLENMMKGRDKA